MDASFGLPSRDAFFKRPDRGVDGSPRLGCPMHPLDRLRAGRYYMSPGIAPRHVQRRAPRVRDSYVL